MSKIFLADNTPALAEYKNILKKKITEVCNKIRFDDTNISWIIYSPQYSYIFNNANANMYGYCKPNDNEIWISINSIHRQANSSLSQAPSIRDYLFKTPKSDFLADVILDEITHIQTKCNHGNEKYDRKLKENREKYYNAIDIMLGIYK